MTQRLTLKLEAWLCRHATLHAIYNGLKNFHKFRDGPVCDLLFMEVVYGRLPYPYFLDDIQEEAAYVLAFNEALIMEERFLKQKAKIEWLRVGDSNSAYFHKAVKGRVSRSIIDVVSDSNVTNQEVKDAIFSMGNDKSPGPDGYTTAFFKEAWDVLANDVTRAVQEFFTNGKLLKELNHTIIA
ncbi:hypothetical protein Tco_1046598, partial [Tanacetum coccineum]